MVNQRYVHQPRPYVQPGPSAMPSGYDQIQFRNFQGVTLGTVQVLLQQQGQIL